MFYKIKFILIVSFFSVFLTLNAFAQGLELFAEDAVIAPPEESENNNELGVDVPELKSADNSAKSPLLTPTKGPLPVATKGPLPVATKGPLPVATKGPLPVATKGPLPVATKGPLPVATKETKSISPEDSLIDNTEELLSKYESVLETNVFSEMSELEKESALLTLQLKREQIRNDIEAVRQKREDALNQEKARLEAIEEKKRDEARENQKSLLVEQQKLKEKEIEFEKVRQEELLNDYKEEMLKEKQEEILSKKQLYDDIKEQKEATSGILNDLRSKFLTLIKSVDNINARAIDIKKAKDKEITSLKTQISVLQSQLIASQAKNPFGGDKEAQKEAERKEEAAKVKLENVYAIMEIRGKGDKLIAKLMNKDGKSFLAQIGTELQTGHIVEDITETYLKADKEGVKDYIYFAAGGILDKEPVATTTPLSSSSSSSKSASSVSSTPASSSAPRSFNVFGGGNSSYMVE
ncbi:MAG: hypothetical protein R3Y43_07295 [Alphaproteobacteria bacterium]